MFRVEVGKGDLRFSAAHFISFLGKCERLHGHNYGVSVVLEGNLSGEGLVFHFGNRRYVFPSSDVFVLPVDNITAERLAEYICKRIMETLQPKAGNLAAVTVGVEEAPGQTAYYRHSFTAEVPPQIT